MENEIIGVRWHGRAGQGTVTAAKMLAQVLISKGKYVQAFPEFGPERRGAPVRAFNRISDKPIYMYGPVDNPDYVIVVDPFILTSPVIQKGMKKETVFIINSEKTKDEIINKIGLNNNKLVVIPATKIAQETLNKDLPNMPMLSAFFSVWGGIDSNELKTRIKDILLSYFAEDIVGKNIKAIERTQEVIYG